MFLKVFKGISPNTGKNPYLLYSSIDNFMTALSSESAGTYATEQYSYRAETGVFRLKWDGDAASAMTVSYACVTDNQTDATYLRAYHVASVTFISGYLEIRTTLDLWGTFYAQAQISNITVTRSNRNIGDGIYDEIALTTPEASVDGVGSSEDLSSICCVFVVQYNVKSASLFGNGAISATKMFAYYKPANYDLKQIVAQVSAIYAAKGGFFGDTEAAVIKAYLCPLASILFNASTQNLPTFLIRDAEELTPTHEIFPCQSTQNVEVGALSPNNNYYIGTLSQAIKIRRSTNAGQHVAATIKTTVSTDGLQISIRNEEGKEEDITDSFSVDITTNDGNMTSLERIQKAISTVGAVAGGIAQISAGGAGIVSGGLQLANVGTNLFVPGSPKFSNGGDGLLTYGDGTKDEQPFKLFSYPSIRNEEERAARFGASFFEHVDSLEAVAGAPALFPSYNMPAFVQASATVSGVNEDARAAVENAIAGGIYIKAV